MVPQTFLFSQSSQAQLPTYLFGIILKVERAYVTRNDDKSFFPLTG